jgi:hypothetical protein
VARRFGTDRFQFEVVDDWPKQEIKGVAASVACDSRSRAYVGVRDIPPGGGFGTILPGGGGSSCSTRTARCTVTGISSSPRPTRSG